MPSLELAVQQAEVDEAAAEAHGRALQPAGAEQEAHEEGAARQARRALEEGDEGRPVPGDLGVEEDQAAHPRGVDQGELARDRGAGVEGEDAVGAEADRAREGAQGLRLGGEAEVGALVPLGLAEARRIGEHAREVLGEARQDAAEAEARERPAVDEEQRLAAPDRAVRDARRATSTNSGGLFQSSEPTPASSGDLLPSDAPTRARSGDLPRSAPASVSLGIRCLPRRRLRRPRRGARGGAPARRSGSTGPTTPSTSDSSVQSFIDTPACGPRRAASGAAAAWPQPCGRLTTPGAMSSVTRTRTSPRCTRLSSSADRRRRRCRARAASFGCRKSMQRSAPETSDGHVVHPRVVACAARAGRSAAARRRRAARASAASSASQARSSGAGASSHLPSAVEHAPRDARLERAEVDAVRAPLRASRSVRPLRQGRKRSPQAPVRSSSASVGVAATSGSRSARRGASTASTRRDAGRPAAEAARELEQDLPVVALVRAAARPPAATSAPRCAPTSAGRSRS